MHLAVIAAALLTYAALDGVAGLAHSEDLHVNYGKATITRSGVVAAVATNGIDDIAELWADSPATTLPGTLWRLFFVREWIRRDPELVARRYATVVDLTGADTAATARLEATLGEARGSTSRMCSRASGSG